MVVCTRSFGLAPRGKSGEGGGSTTAWAEGRCTRQSWGGAAVTRGQVGAAVGQRPIKCVARWLPQLQGQVEMSGSGGPRWPAVVAQMDRGGIGDALVGGLHGEVV